MKDRILTILTDSLTVQERSVRANADQLAAAAEKMAARLAAGGKLLIFGNGGSAADAQHLAAELVNRFQMERAPLAALALSTDTSVLTSIGNDRCFDDIFARQIQALAKANDVAWAISTSGDSPNVLAAVEAAGAMGLMTLGMTGRGGRLSAAADLVLTVDSAVTARIQETHIVYGHLLCDLIERFLFPHGTPL